MNGSFLILAYEAKEGISATKKDRCYRKKSRCNGSFHSYASIYDHHEGKFFSLYKIRQPVKYMFFQSPPEPTSPEPAQGSYLLEPTPESALPEFTSPEPLPNLSLL